MGHPAQGMNFVPLITAFQQSKPDCVKILLEAGADPLEPTHYGGASTLPLARWNFSNLQEVTESDRECMRLLEEAVKDDPRVAWLGAEIEE